MGFRRCWIADKAQYHRCCQWRRHYGYHGKSSGGNEIAWWKSGGAICRTASSVPRLIGRPCTTKKVALRYGELVYDGMWFTQQKRWQPLSTVRSEPDYRDGALSSIRAISWLPGKIPVFPHSQEFVAFERDEVYNQADTGFINLFGLPLKVRKRWCEEKAGLENEVEAVGRKDFLNLWARWDDQWVSGIHQLW